MSELFHFTRGYFATRLRNYEYWGVCHRTDLFGSSYGIELLLCDKKERGGPNVFGNALRLYVFTLKSVVSIMIDFKHDIRDLM